MRSESQRLRTARLGAGLTTIPPAPAIDASKAIMKDPVVPEDKRFCSNCGNPVGRGKDGHPGRTTGFCAKCRQAFSFDPKLKPGDLVAGQYEVAGCLAHGGLGWIYLARDKNVSNRWVVLKGLLNSGDPDALAAAIAEQRFLAQVSHPHIVEIYNFVTHDDAGYIVMEYVGGTSLKSILKQRMRKSGRYDPIPADQALAYIIEILPAFQYLHDLGLVYCDFKPDNLIQVGDMIKLIDLGGVRRIDDEDSAIFGTVGYQAPEVAAQGTTVASDIYTIGRTLVVLMMEFRGYQSTYVDSLPPVESTPLFQKYDSLYRLLLKACATSPDDRFASADELRVQMLGVLREVVAQNERLGRATSSSTSLLFEEPAIETDRLDWHTLPGLRIDPSDPQASWLHGLTTQGTPAGATRVAAQGSWDVDRGPPRHLPRGARRRAARPRRLLGQRHAARRPVGVARRLDAGPLGARSRATRGWPRAPSTRSTARSPVSWRPSSRWPAPARPAMSSPSPRTSTRRAPGPTRTTPRRRPSGWRGSGPSAGRRRGGPGPRPRPRDVPCLLAGASGPGEPARGLRRRHTRPVAGVVQRRPGPHGPARASRSRRAHLLDRPRRGRSSRRAARPDHRVPSGHRTGYA